MSAVYESERRKDLGAFYTPRPMAAKLVEWAIRTPTDSMIDPSLGGSIFLEVAKERLLALGDGSEDLRDLVYGVDMDEVALQVAREHEGLDDVTLIHADFFDLNPESLPRFTANVGNPPYVRYQRWARKDSPAHGIAESMGVKLTRLASTWAPFILQGCRFLAPGGRLGQVLPAELLHAQYASPVIQYLTRSFREVTIAVFQDRVFPGALEEVVLLFADGFEEGPADGIGVVSARDIAELDLASIDGRGRGPLTAGLSLLALLPRRTRSLYQRLEGHQGVRPLGDLARVNIGAVTGANAFFIRGRDEIEARGFAPEMFKTVISKANDVPGARVSRADIDRLASGERRTELLAANGHSPEQLASIKDLVAEGERLGLHTRYKCRVRSPWWSVPLPKGGAPDLFLTYMSDMAPRLVRNKAAAVSTNTIHQVFTHAGVSADALAVAFYNSLTLLSAELVGRSYGGGILKLEPTEAGRLLIPGFDPAIANSLTYVDRLLRGGDLDAAVDRVDALVLTPLGLGEADIAALRAARGHLLTRRRSRNAEPK